DRNVELKIGSSVWYDGKMGVVNNRKAVKIDNIYKELR
ncbi:MAG: FliM/FliN family flagellar motor switch protein, partial [Oscillospiraceae bacterium]|nr:FliM/FliN family flagellar motor switch protein [Oscillospiraceae bacterium]